VNQRFGVWHGPCKEACDPLVAQVTITPALRGLSHIAQGHRMDTLQSLDNVPQAHDSVAAWFDPLLSERLEQAGFGTLRQLVQRINDTGTTWWYPVRGIGVTRAERLVQWLHEQQESTGMQVDLTNLQAHRHRHRPVRHAPARPAASPPWFSAP